MQKSRSKSLYLLLPLAIGCSINKEVLNDELYFNKTSFSKKSKQILRDAAGFKLLENYTNGGGGNLDTTYWKNYFINSVYQSDGDSLINYDDPYPYQQSPFVNMNNNGIVDVFDDRVSLFQDTYFGRYGFCSHYRWLAGHPRLEYVSHPYLE